MRYRKLTDTGDYSFGNNTWDYIDGVEAVALAIKSKVLLFYGEWWEDISIGIPMFQSIIGQVSIDNVTMALQNLLTKRIMEVEQVISVDDMQVETNRERRSVHVTVRCTIQGNEQLEVGFEF